MYVWSRSPSCLDRLVELLQPLGVAAQHIKQAPDLDGRLGRFAQVLAAQVLDHQALPADERAAPRGFGGGVVAGRVGGVAQQALEPRAAFDRADRVARGILRAADASSPSRMIWAARAGSPRLSARFAELHGHLGGRLAFLARPQEQRLGAIDLAGVDVAARQLEVDVGVARPSCSVARKRCWVSANRCFSASASAYAGRVALGIEAQAQAQEVELDQLGRDVGP